MRTVSRPQHQAAACQLRSSHVMTAPIRRPVRLLAPGPLRAPCVTTFCSSGVAHPGEEANMSHQNGQFDPMMAVPNVVAAKGGDGGRNYGSGSSLGAVMERSKLNFVMPTPPAQAPKLDDGGSGGDIGKGIHNGGGGGDGDGGDDDDYFNEEGDGDGEGDGEGGNAFFRTVIPESYDKLSIGAVFAEWMRTVAEMPLVLRRAVEMGLFSSAQLVRFFSMDVRPNLTRNVSRALPPAWARDFVGRLMADPAFVQKMVIESTIAAFSSLYYEYRARGERFRDELDLALINSLGMAAATAATVWMVAPTRSYGNVHKFPWQQMLDSLPNCVFDANGPLRAYTPQSRIAGFFSKAAELSAVGLITGSATSLLSSAAVAARRQFGNDPNFEPSIAIPDVARSSAGLAAFFALSANTRYQLLGGMDRYLLGHSNFLWTYLATSGVARFVSNQMGETHRALCQGLPDATSLPRRRVVKKKVVVRRKVVKPTAPVEPQQQPLHAVTAVVAAEHLLAQPHQAEEHATAETLVPTAAVSTSGQEAGEAVLLDQVLTMAAGSSADHADVLYVQAEHAHAASSLGQMAAAGDSESDSSAIDLNSLVAQQASGSAESLSSERPAASRATSSGQLVAAGQR